jgi:hypothetical protein
MVPIRALTVAVGLLVVALAAQQAARLFGLF